MNINKKVLLSALSVFVFPVFAFAAINSLNGQTGTTQLFTNDANVTVTSTANNHTINWAGLLSPDRGGTGNNSLTKGSIPFIGNGGVYKQNNQNLFWDNANNFLGINTNNPTEALDVVGNIKTNGVLNVFRNIVFNTSHPWDALISSADQVTGDAKASDIVIQSGASHGSINGSNLRFFSGNGGTILGGGGNISMEAGNGVGSDETGGSNSTGGGLTFISGSAGITGNGGKFTFSGGAGGTTSGDGGGALFQGGSSYYGDGGSFTFNGGYPGDSEHYGGSFNVLTGGGLPANGGSIIMTAQRHGNINLLAQDGGSVSIIASGTMNLEGSETMNLTGGNINFSGPIMSQMEFKNPVNKFVNDSNSTVHIGADGFPGCIVMGDDDSSGVSYITVNDGVMNVTTTKPSNCN